jgi:hypothetical protein
VAVAISDGPTNGPQGSNPNGTVSLTVNSVNDEPSFTIEADQTVNEDAGAQSVAGFAGGFDFGPADEDAAQAVDAFVVSNDNNALFAVQPTIAPDGTLTYTPIANAHGSATVTVQLRDNGGTANGGDNLSLAQTFTITVNSVNDEPSFAVGANQTVNEDAGAQTVASCASGFDFGPADEDGSQAVDAFVVSNDSNALFAVQPTIAPDGTLTYTPAANANGSATVTVQLRDNGGTANGGDDLSQSQTFTITVNSVNDEPSFAVGADQTVDEDAGTQTVAGFASGFDAGPVDEDGSQAVDSYVVSNDNNALFAVQPTIAPDGTLTYTPAANANGSATVTVQLRDNGGAANGGDDLSQAQIFIITVNPVNDPPQSGAVVLTAIVEDSGTRIITQDELLSGVTDPDGPPPVARDLAIASGLGSLADNGDGTWTYTPAANDDTQVSFSYAIDDGVASPVAANASLDITPENDAPQSGAVVLAAIAEDSGARVIRQDELLAEMSDPDGPRAVARDLAIVAGLSALVDNGDGTWTYTPAANDDTAVSFSYVIDDGLASPVTANASLDITPVNDAPQSGAVVLVAIAEDSGPRVIRQDELLAGVSDPDGPPAVARDLAIASGLGALVDNGNGTWTYTPAPNDDTQVSFSYVIDDGVASPVTANASLDVTPVADPPRITSNGGVATVAISLAENIRAVTTVTVVHPDGSPLSYSITGGADRDLFTIDATTGELAFIDAPNFEAPADADRNNTYVVDVRASDGLLSDDQAISVTVTDAAREGATRNDFDGDGKADILWQNDNGTPAIWTMDGTNVVSGADVGPFNPAPAWKVIGSGDFNGDGKADILWQHNDGTVAEWLMDGAVLLAGASVAFNPGPSWHAKDAADFNGDGKADILWQNDDGAAAVWLMDGTTIVSGANVGPNVGPAWEVKSTGDFNGDGKADILWQNHDGAAAIWLMDGTTVLSGANVGPINPGPTWNVVAAADFNGDSKADILWQNNDGQVAIWEMDGLNFVEGRNVGPNVGPSWVVTGANDYNGDGRSDILWQNADGTPAIWLMDGFDLVSGTSVGPFNPGPSWHVIDQNLSPLI